MRRDGLQPFRQLSRLLVGLAAEYVSEGELTQLLCGRVDQFLLGIAKRRAPQAGHALNIVIPIRVPDANAFAAVQDQRTCFAEGIQICIGVDDGFDIADGGIAERGHEIGVLSVKGRIGGVAEARLMRNPAARESGQPALQSCLLLQ